MYNLVFEAIHPVTGSWINIIKKSFTTKEEALASKYEMITQLKLNSTITNFNTSENFNYRINLKDFLGYKINIYEGKITYEIN